VKQLDHAHSPGERLARCHLCRKRADRERVKVLRRSAVFGQVERLSAQDRINSVPLLLTEPDPGMTAGQAAAWPPVNARPCVASSHHRYGYLLFPVPGRWPRTPP
jgi:hypothetical protein